MNTMLRLAALALLTVLIFPNLSCTKNEAPKEGALVSSHSSPALTWEKDWDTAFQLAASKNQPVLVNFYADWCIWCKRLESTTFTDPDVASLLSASFVGLRMKIDGRGGPYAKAYKVQAPPTLLLLDKDGRELGRIPGFMPPSPFLERFNRFLPASQR